jgi:A/G-specific adenine glycosylase
MKSDVAGFASKVVAWQKRHGRHDLPWQNTRDPYRIWLSEIMLQQTQVAAVLGYFQRFVQRFPDLPSLAVASQEEVMQCWSGLGYYSRARNLHRAAQVVMEQHGGVFPSDLGAIEQLPGIGRSTAAAICAFSFGQRAAILDGNVKRVLARVFAIDGFPGAPTVERQMWNLAEQLLPPAKDIVPYTQGLMDLGATLCSRSKPRCTDCPLQIQCHACQQGRTAELPAPRPKRVRPEREIAVWIVRSTSGIWVQQRAPSGIWGGLLSLPEGRSEADGAPEVPAAIVALGQLGVPEQLPSVAHDFTHFRLQLQPWLVDLVRTSQIVAEPGGRWLSVHDVPGAALPAPIKKLLLATCNIQ